MRYFLLLGLFLLGGCAPQLVRLTDERGSEVYECRAGFRDVILDCEVI